MADFARVRHGYPEKTSFSRLNGIDAVNIDVYKSSSANVVNVANSVRSALKGIQGLPQFGGQLSTKVFRDQSEDISKSLDDLQAAGIYGGILAMGVLFFFLRKFRSTIIISVAILGAFAVIPINSNGETIANLAANVCGFCKGSGTKTCNSCRGSGKAPNGKSTCSICKARSVRWAIFP